MISDIHVEINLHKKQINVFQMNNINALFSVQSNKRYEQKLQFELANEPNKSTDSLKYCSDLSENYTSRLNLMLGL